MVLVCSVVICCVVLVSVLCVNVMYVVFFVSVMVGLLRLSYSCFGVK